MQAQPVAAFAFGHDRRVVGKPLQVRRRLRAAGDRFAQVGANRLEDRDPHEERRFLDGQPRYHRLEEESFEVATTGAQFPDYRMEVGRALDGGCRQLQAQRPALHEVMQAHGIVEPDPVAEANSQQFERLVQRHEQVTDVDRGQPPAGDQVRQVEFERPARPDQELQVRRCVIQEVCQHFTQRVLRHAVCVVQDDDRGCGEHRHLGQQGRQRVEIAIGLELALERRGRERVTPAGGPQSE